MNAVEQNGRFRKLANAECFIHLQRLAPLAGVLFLTACQSGRIGHTQFSADGTVVAFADAHYPAVYVADDRRVVKVGRGSFLLSADGSLLVLMDDDGMPGQWEGFECGAKLTLHHIASGKRLVTHIPFDLPGYLLSERQIRPARGNGTERAHDMRFLSERFAVFFEGGFQVTLGPVIEGYWSWAPNVGWRISEQPSVAGQYVEDWLEPAADVLIQRAPDGWNARRTVWIRPDGSTVELLRQNDVLPRMLGLGTLAPVQLLSPLWHFSIAQQVHELSPQDEDKSRAEYRRILARRRQGEN